MNKVNQFLGEKDGQKLCAEIYREEFGYSIKYFINETLQTTESFPNNSIYYVEDAAENWISGIKTL